MKLSFKPASLCSLFRPIRLHTLPNRSSVNCTQISCRPISPELQIPLFLKPATYRATLSDLRNWKFWAKNWASSVGSTLLDLDNGPESTFLHRELKWLIEDALEDPGIVSALSQTNNSSDYSVVSLRVCLDDLYLLWKQRIEQRRPFQYVVGCEHWRDLVLSVQEGVLIPRPETELIVDLVDDVIKGNGIFRDGLWADLGTGSGALAIGIGRILGSSGRVVATDLSPVAVMVASYNVKRYHLQDKVAIKHGSWFEPLRDDEGKFAGLVSNPPYIPSDDIPMLQAEVAKHEPRLALDGGSNGMDDLLHLCNGAASMLRPGGFFIFETNGEKQCKFLADYMETKGKGFFHDVKTTPDFAGIQRFVSGYRNS